MTDASAYKDRCPECLEGPYEPYETEVRGQSLVGAYRCPACGHVWACWWNLASLAGDASPALLAAADWADGLAADMTPLDGRRPDNPSPKENPR